MSTTPSHRRHVSEYTVHPGLYSGHQAALAVTDFPTCSTILPTRRVEGSQRALSELA